MGHGVSEGGSSVRAGSVSDSDTEIQIHTGVKSRSCVTPSLPPPPPS